MIDDAGGRPDEPGEGSGDVERDEPGTPRVGYKNPPVASRFKKGVSGNPKGRPRGRRSFRTELREVLDAKVIVTEGGRKSKVSTSMAMLLRLRQQALNGEPRAIDRLLLFAAAHLPADPPDEADTLFEDDEAIIEAFKNGPTSKGDLHDD